MRSVLSQLPKDEPKPAARVKPTISLEAMISKLQTRIEQRMKTRFSELRHMETEHKNVIVGFLAILELFKQGNVIITQERRFADIELELDRQQTPRYY
jgi:chromatin segregation and condensation protein Rec8/ScpA/Scc1 (kleisin family)